VDLISMQNRPFLRPTESYWKVQLDNGNELSELDSCVVAIDGERVRVRRLEWLEDLIGSGDLRHVRSVQLCTPAGSRTLNVTEPYTVFQFSRGMFGLDPVSGQMSRQKHAQVIGVITDKELGTCQFVAWDVQLQRIYEGVTTVHDFGSWREGMHPIGALNITVMDLRGVRI
jgi:hypothetical protein